MGKLQHIGIWSSAIGFCLIAPLMVQAEELQQECKLHLNYTAKSYENFFQKNAPGTCSRLHDNIKNVVAQAIKACHKAAITTSGLEQARVAAKSVTTQQVNNITKEVKKPSGKRQDQTGLIHFGEAANEKGASGTEKEQQLIAGLKNQHINFNQTLENIKKAYEKIVWLEIDTNTVQSCVRADITEYNVISYKDKLEQLIKETEAYQKYINNKIALLNEDARTNQAKIVVYDKNAKALDEAAKAMKSGTSSDDMPSISGITEKTNASSAAAFAAIKNDPDLPKDMPKSLGTPTSGVFGADRYYTGKTAEGKEFSIDCSFMGCHPTGDGSGYPEARAAADYVAFLRDNPTAAQPPTPMPMPSIGQTTPPAAPAEQPAAPPGGGANAGGADLSPRDGIVASSENGDVPAGPQTGAQSAIASLLPKAPVIASSENGEVPGVATNQAPPSAPAPSSAPTAPVTPAVPTPAPAPVAPPQTPNPFASQDEGVDNDENYKLPGSFVKKEADNPQATQNVPPVANTPAPSPQNDWSGNAWSAEQWKKYDEIMSASGAPNKLSTSEINSGFSALQSSSSISSILSQAQSNSEAVKKIQNAINATTAAVSYPDGDDMNASIGAIPDGVMGSRTKSALIMIMNDPVKKVEFEKQLRARGLLN